MDDVTLWFLVLEVQFRTGRITSDEAKFQIAISNIDMPYVRLVRDIVIAPSETGQYEFLKKELIKILRDWVESV